MAAAPGQFSSGLPGTSTLSNLTPEQLKQLCSAANSYSLTRFFTVAADPYCKYVAVIAAGYQNPPTDAELRQNCQWGYDLCIQNPSAITGGTPAVEACPNPTGCNATVSEYEQCLSEWQLALEGALGGLPECNTLTLSSLPVQFVKPGMPVSCLVVYSKCPGA
jgi:hypothetical protein